MELFNRWKNRLEKRIELAIDAQKKPVLFSFEWLLKLMSKIYLLVVRARLWLFETGILKQKVLPCFVISVGNIVVGGAGKTPMAICLAQMLKKMGKTSVVVSRGYQGMYQSDALVVSDGTQIFSTADQAGDEPFMMAQKKQFPVVVGKDRFCAGEKAIQAFAPDVIILDDGFQHLKLKRDLDLVLFDFSNPLGNGNCLPAGRLREPIGTSSQRADALIFTRCPSSKMPQTTGKKQTNHMAAGGSMEKIHQSFGHVPKFKTCHAPFVCAHVLKGDTARTTGFGIEDLKGKNAILFSGIAKNASFGQTMAECGVNIVDHLEFKDHYRYKKSDLDLINAAAVKLDADMILTTEKDWVKVMQNTQWDKDIVAVGVQILFEDFKGFESFLNQKMGGV